MVTRERTWSGRRRPGTALSCLVLAVGCTLAGLLGLAGCGGATPRPSETWGGFPTWLPTPTQADNQVLPGSQASPALAEQGDGILAELPDGGAVLAVITGPLILNPGLGGTGSVATGIWTVTMSEATVPVQIAVDDFAGWDSNGQIYHPTVVSLATSSIPIDPSATVLDALPATLEPGQTVVFGLQATIAAGEGVMQWAPDGRTPIGSWDFILEND